MSTLSQRESKIKSPANPAKETTADKLPPTKRAEGDKSDDGDEGSDESDEDGGLVLVKKRSLDASGEGLGDMEVDEDIEPVAKKKRKMRITSDGVAAAGVSKKRVFDDNGKPVVSACVSASRSPAIFADARCRFNT